MIHGNLHGFTVGVSYSIENNISACIFFSIERLVWKKNQYVILWIYKDILHMNHVGRTSYVRANL